MSLRNLMFGLIGAVGVCGTSVAAATVGPSSNVVFEFDLSGEGELNINQTNYSCDACGNTTLTLAVGATMRVKYGTSAGSADIATREFVNISPMELSGGVGLFSDPPFLISADVDTLFATFEYVDDIYGVDQFIITETDLDVRFDRDRIRLEGSLSTIPVPASLPLLLAGIGGLALIGRRRKTS